MLAKESRISILFVIDGMEFGGGERTFLQLIQHLPQDAFSCHVATNPDGVFARKLHSIGITVHPFELSSKLDLRNVPRLRSIAREHRIDIVHSQGARADFFTRMAVRKMKDVRLISTIAMPVDGFDVNPWLRSIYKTADRYTEQFVDHFIVVSNRLRNTLINKHHIPAEKVTLIYNGIELDDYNPDLFQQTSAKIRKEFAIPSSTFLVAAVGRLVWQKGFEYLIEASRKLALDNIIILMIGDGPLNDQLRQKVNQYGLDKTIIFAGSRQDVPVLLATADAIAIPSLLEGFPMVTLEAMAMQIPVVASDIPGIDEQIIDRRHGLLIPPKDPEALADAIIALASDRRLAISLASAARARAKEEFTLDRMISSTIRLYEKLMARNMSELGRS